MDPPLIGNQASDISHSSHPCRNEFYHNHLKLLPPPRQPSDVVLASSAGGPGFISLSRTASY